MGIIKALKLGFDYQRYDDDGNVVDMQRAVNDVDLDIKAGEFVAVLGHNGSGKSTLAKHMNALLIPTEGTMLVDGIDTARETKLWKVRQKAGMVFQNPDNQIIGTVVEEDVGFGPENMGWASPCPFLHIMFFNIFCAVLSAHVVFYHQISPLSITNLIFFSKNWTYSFNFCYMSIFTGIFTLFCSLFYSLFSFKNASATTRSSGVVILILR